LTRLLCGPVAGTREEGSVDTVNKATRGKAAVTDAKDRNTKVLKKPLIKIHSKRQSET